MRKPRLLLLALCAGMLLSVGAAQAATRIAVMDFENRTPYRGWQVGRGASDMLATALVKRTRFSVIERDKLASIMAEQDLNNDATRFDPGTATAIGKLLGAQYVVTGAVTEYGRSRSGGSGFGISLGKQGYSAAVDIRIVDVTTGEIVFAEDAEETESSLSVKALGFSAGESFDEKKATKAMRGAIDKVSKEIAKIKLEPGAASGQASAEGTRALVADVDGKILTLNQGSNAGFKVGQKVDIMRQHKLIKDPETGKVIKIKYKKIGTIKLTEVDTGYAEGEVVSGSGFAVKDVAKK